MSKILLLEFNEICPPLLKRWMGEGKLPNFSALHNSSQVFTSVADVSDPDYLEPWIQWYSIHTGLPYDEHGIFYLTDGPKADHPDIWRRLSGLGKSVMNCGSMNARALSGTGVFYLPDPWCNNEPAWPKEVEVFKAVMAKLVQESTRGAALGMNEWLPFLTFLLRHGLAADTVRAILAQLGSERLSQADVKWRRVALADRLQFDLFRHYYRKMRPDFATFFINSTAHLQHAYWRHMDPDAFSVKPDKGEIESYGDAVLFGYRSMDALIRRFCTIAEPNTTIILCSALSQQPFLKREASGGQHFYRLRDVPRFLQMLGVAPQLVEPVMTHQYRLRFADRDAAQKALSVLEQLKLGDERLFGARLDFPAPTFISAARYSTNAMVMWRRNQRNARSQRAPLLFRPALCDRCRQKRAPPPGGGSLDRYRRTCGTHGAGIDPRYRPDDLRFDGSPRRCRG